MSVSRCWTVSWEYSSNLMNGFCTLSKTSTISQLTYPMLTLTSQPAFKMSIHVNTLSMNILRKHSCFTEPGAATTHQPIQAKNINIPILPMAFLTFAEAKVVAPPIPPRKNAAHTVQIIKGFPCDITDWACKWWLTGDSLVTSLQGRGPMMMTHGEFPCCITDMWRPLWVMTHYDTPKYAEHWKSRLKHWNFAEEAETRTKLKRPPPLSGGA